MTTITVPPSAGAAAQPVPFEKFNAPLDTQYDEAASQALGYDVWRITKAFTFNVGSEGSDTFVNVPAGYLSDGASVPKFFWDLLPPWGVYGQAAVVHDILCETLSVTKAGVATPITRAKCDSIFKEAMIAAGTPVWKRNVMYIAVRVFSKLFRDNHPVPDAKKSALEASWVPAS